MYPIFNEWQKLIKKIFSLNGLIFLKNVFLNYTKSLKAFFCFFGALIILDISLFLKFGNFFLKINLLSQNIKNIPQSYFWLIIIFSTINFILSTGLLLSIRKKGNVSWFYFKKNFFEYIKLKFILSLFVYLILFLLINMGISNFPELHWSVFASINLLELITVFFWLDSSFQFTDIFKSVERAINLIIYQYPFFVIVSLIWIPINFILKYFFSGFKIGYHVYKILNPIEIQNFFNSQNGILNLEIKIKFLLLRYFLFFIAYFFVTVIYTFYSKKRRIIFSETVFKPIAVEDE